MAQVELAANNNMTYQTANEDTIQQKVHNQQFQGQLEGQQQPQQDQ